jgi:hypothetical protein
MEKRIQNASSSLNSSLGECFEVGLKERNEAIVFRCLRAYAAINNTKGAHEVFRLFIVAPIMDQVFSATNADVSPTDLLEEDLNEIRMQIESECRFLLDIAMTGI